MFDMNTITTERTDNYCSIKAAMSNECKPKEEMNNDSMNKTEAKTPVNITEPTTSEKVQRSRNLKKLQYYKGPNRHSHKQLFKSDFDVNKFARETHSRRPKRLLKEVIRYEPTIIPDRKIKKLKNHTDNLAVGEGFQCPRCGTCCFYDDTECRQCFLRCRYMAGTGVVVLKERNDGAVEGQKKDWFSSNCCENKEEKKVVIVRDVEVEKKIEKAWTPLSYNKIILSLPSFLSLPQSAEPHDVDSILNLLSTHIKYIQTSIKTTLQMDKSYTIENNLFKKCLRDRQRKLEFEQLEKHNHLMSMKNRVVFTKKNVTTKEWKEFINRPMLFDGRIKKFDSCGSDCPLCNNHYSINILGVAPDMDSPRIEIPSPKFRVISPNEYKEDKKNGFLSSVDFNKQQKKLFDLQEASNNLMFVKRYNEGPLKAESYTY